MDGDERVFLAPTGAAAAAAGRRSEPCPPKHDPRDPLAVAPAPPPGRRGKKRALSPPPGADICVTGYACERFRNDELAQWLHTEKHLQPWMEDKELLVDRYDARLLVEDAALFRKLKSFALKSGTESTELEQQLNEERFRDLPATETADPPRDDRAVEEPEEARGGGGQDALPPGGVAGAAAAAKAREAAAAINKRWKQSKQPAEIDEKSRQILQRTAVFVCSQPGGAARAIDVLKFKQPDNRTFDFLLHDHPWHGLFRSLVKECESSAAVGSATVGSPPGTTTGAATAGTTTGAVGGRDESPTPGGLAALAGYADSSSESDSEEAAPAAEATPDAPDGDGPQADTRPAAPAPLTAERLARARPPGDIAVPSEPSVLAMIVKLLEHRRTHRGDWGEFEAQLLLRSAERFAFLRASDPHHAFWRWAWNQISFF